MEQTLHCTLFTNPTWPCISCRCGSLIHNELIMVLLVQDCFPFPPRTHVDGDNLYWRCGSAGEDIAPCMKHRLWNVLLQDSRLWVVLMWLTHHELNGSVSLNNSFFFPFGESPFCIRQDYNDLLWRGKKNPHELSNIHKRNRRSSAPCLIECLWVYLWQMKPHDTELQINDSIFWSCTDIKESSRTRHMR